VRRLDALPSHARRLAEHLAACRSVGQLQHARGQRLDG
jgi:hypothetical protein